MTPTLQAQILTLRKYQAWRTGEDTRTMDDAGIVPAAVTSALDAVLEIAESCLRDAANPAAPVKRKRPYAQGTALGEFGVIPMCDQVDDDPVNVPSDEEILEVMQPCELLTSITRRFYEDEWTEQVICKSTLLEKSRMLIAKYAAPQPTEPDSKSGIRLGVSWVRIPPCPPECKAFERF